MKKIILLLLILLAFNGCIFSSNKRNINNRYNKLVDKFYKLTDSEISEDERDELEKDFENFVNNMKKSKKDVKDGDIEYLDEYIKKSEIKLQNLKDLKD